MADTFRSQRKMLGLGNRFERGRSVLRVYFEISCIGSPIFLFELYCAARQSLRFPRWSGADGVLFCGTGRRPRDAVAISRSGPRSDHQAQQGIKGKWLWQVGERLEFSEAIRIDSDRRKHDCRNDDASLAKISKHVPSGLVRKVDVEQKKIRMNLQNGLDGLLRRRRLANVDSARHQTFGDDPPKDIFVVHKNDSVIRHGNLRCTHGSHSPSMATWLRRPRSHGQMELCAGLAQ